MVLLFEIWLLYKEFYFRGMLYWFNVLVGFDCVFFVCCLLIIVLDLFCNCWGVIYVKCFGLRLFCCIKLLLCLEFWKIDEYLFMVEGLLLLELFNVVLLLFFCSFKRLLDDWIFVVKFEFWVWVLKFSWLDLFWYLLGGLKINFFIRF